MTHSGVEHWLDEEAYLQNALWDLRMARSTVYDGLSGKNDLYLKFALLEDLDAVESSIRKAMQ